MSQIDFSSIKEARKPLRINPKRITQYYSEGHPDRLAVMQTKYDKAVRERAAKAREGMLARMRDKEYVANWGIKNKPDHYLGDEVILKGYTDFMKQQPIKVSMPRGEFPDSYKTRKQKREAKKAAIMDQLRQVFPSGSTEKDLGIYYRRGKEQYNKMRGYEKRKLTDEEKDERVLRSMVHMTRPAAVMKYADEVQKYDGVDYPAEERITDFKPGDYPQFDPQVRDKAVKMFAELTGTLGIMPTYDPKLTSIESAKRIYPEEDYDIRLYDMDGDDLTPGTLIIKKKYDIDKEGNYVALPQKDWKIVAVNGYRLQNPTEASNIRRLKDMDYYNSHPTSESRRKEPFGEFTRKNYKKMNIKVFTALKGIIRQYIDSYYPNHSYMQMIINRTPINNLYFTVSPIVLNTIIARAARIWALFIYAGADLELLDKSKDLSKEAAIFREYCDDLDGENTTIAPYSTLYKKFLLEPVVENFILRHKAILQLLIDEADKLINGDDKTIQSKRNDIFTFITLATKGFININDKVVDMCIGSKGTSIADRLAEVAFTFIDNPLPNAVEIAMAPFSDKRGKSGEPSPLESKRGITYWGSEYLGVVGTSTAFTPSTDDGWNSPSTQARPATDDDNEDWGNHQLLPSGPTSGSSSSDRFNTVH